MALRSVLLAGPGGTDLDEALSTEADALVFSLVDDRIDAQEARRAAADGIGAAVDAGKRAIAQVNHPRTRLLRADLEAVVSAGLHAVVVPHCTEPQDVRDVAVGLREFEHSRGIEPGTVTILPTIDTARGLLRVADIVAAAPRVAGIVFAADGYALDVGARLEEHGPRLSYARGAAVAAARAVDGIPLVSGTFLELRAMSHYGFAGAIVGDATRVLVANDAFQPTEADIARARHHLAAYDAARAEGAWVARYEGELVDAHRARKARIILGEIDD